MFKFKKNKSQIRSLVPYLLHGQWVFDSDKHGLYEEAFVCGMTEIIDQVLTENDIDPESVEHGFRLTFASKFWPKATHRLKWVRKECDGNIYEITLNNGETMQGWLCPALLCYFDKAPREIYVGVERC